LSCGCCRCRCCTTERVRWSCDTAATRSRFFTSEPMLIRTGSGVQASVIRHSNDPYKPGACITRCWLIGSPETGLKWLTPVRPFPVSGSGRIVCANPEEIRITGYAHCGCGINIPVDICLMRNRSKVCAFSLTPCLRSREVSIRRIH